MAVENTLVLSVKEMWSVLYYETGFEQLHPKPEVYGWMQEQGYEYNVDWTVKHSPSIDHGDMPYYYIVFNDKEIMPLFALKWLGRENNN